MITLSDGTTTINLPDDLYWSDELLWTPVAASREFSTTGAQLIDVSVQQAGRPITLKAESEEFSWMKRGDILTLQAMAYQPDKSLVLTFHDTQYTVIFAPGEKPLEAEPIFHLSPMEADDSYSLTAIRFITV